MEMFVLVLAASFLGAVLAGLVFRLVDRWAGSRREEAERRDRRQEVLERHLDVTQGPPFRT